MTAMELQTASQFGIGVKVLVLNNRFQGMVLQWQGTFNTTSSFTRLAILNFAVRIDLFYDARYSHTSMTNPDFILLARAMGVHAIRCETHEELPAKMKEFLEYPGDKPVFMECLVETNEHVFPMVWLLLAFGNSLQES